MSAHSSLLLLASVLTLGIILSRRAQSGYIDFLTPMLAMYFLHSVTRGAFILYEPEQLSLNPRVLGASEGEIAQALLLTVGGVFIFVLAYLGAMRFAPEDETPANRFVLPPLRTAIDLLALGFVCRGVLRLAREGLVALPNWAINPIDTLSWAALLGIFLASFRWGRSQKPVRRQPAALVAVLGVLAVMAVDGRFSSSREASLQLVICAAGGWMMGRGTSLLRIGVVFAIAAVPLLVWVGAMKDYQHYGLGPGEGYAQGIPAVRAYRGYDWVRFLVASVQGRFHALDSLIVCRAVVPAERPFERGSVWSRVFLSAFVPRVLYPEKQVGWGTRFAVEFWGAPPQAEGKYAVGISHMGEMYVHGGRVGCLTGMAILGAGLGLLACALRRRRDVIGLALFAMIAMTVCQIDRDLEVSLGGTLKLLAIFFAIVFFSRVKPRRAARRAPLARDSLGADAAQRAGPRLPYPRDGNLAAP